MKTKVARWGNSLALRLPKQLITSYHLSEGSDVEIVEEAEGLLVKPVSKRQFQLDDQLNGSETNACFFCLLHSHKIEFLDLALLSIISITLLRRPRHGNRLELDENLYMPNIYWMLSEFTRFDWDDGNLLKNWEKHQVSYLEAEQIFFNQPILVYEDQLHSQTESRWYVLGKTDQQRLLMAVFTKRGDQVRVISARDMSREERSTYEEKT